MKPLPKPEDPAAVQAALTAVLERPAAPRRVHAWACARCGDDRKTETPPPSPRFCPRCAARILEMHTEPATPKHYGDDEDDDGAPIERPPAPRSTATRLDPEIVMASILAFEEEFPPVAREHIQADTPVEAPACPIGEPAAPTATAEEGEKGMAKVETKRSAPKREPVGPARRPCGCGLTGRHMKTCALAPKEEPGVHICPDCAKDCLSKSGLGGHMAWCEKRKARLTREAAPVDDGQGEFLIHEAVMRAFPERAGKIENPAGYAAAIRDMSFALKEAREAAAARPVPEPPTPAPSPPERFIALGTSIGELVARKNVAYGDSFAKAGDFLRLLFPERILPEQYGDALALVRVFDKQMRIATAKDALGESPWTDIAGYGLLAASRATTGAKTEARG